MERVLVLGARGMLGSELMALPSSRFELTGLCHEELDITDEEKTFQIIQEIKPSTVIHAAAYTDVDGCEMDPDRAFSVNGQGTLHVAQACQMTGAGLVYLSTDYVFDGNGSRPYREDDPVNPINVYGKSKLEGEKHVERLLEQYTVVRSQWLFGKGGKNFVTTLLSLAEAGKPLTIVRDHIGSPTYARDLGLAIFRLLEKGCRGVFHVANRLSCSWHEFAVEILRTAEISDTEIIPVEWASLGRPAQRPHYSVLNCEKLTEQTGLEMRPWQEALREFVKERGTA